MMQPQNKFRYQITNRLGVLQAAPLGESDFTKQWSRESDAKLDYKNELPSKIIFTGAAYRNLLKLERSIYRCDYIALSVQRRCESEGVETWVEWFSGRFSLNEGVWDLDRCQVEIKLDDLKNEQCYEDNKSREINLLDGGVRRTVLLNPTNITIEKISYSASSTEACESPAYWGGAGDPFAQGWGYYAYTQTRVISLNTCDLTTQWAREVVLIPCGDPAPGPEWVLVVDGCPGMVKYARPPRVYGCTYNYPDSGADYQVTEYNCNLIGDSDVTVSIDNGLPLDYVMSQFIQAFCPGMTFVSNFFQINPDVESDINYVTGQPSKTKYLTLFQKSDVKRPSVSGNATKAMLSWEKAVQMLVEMFNLQWRIEGTIFRMEHVSYWGRNVGFDLTQPNYARYMVGKNKYTYQNQDIPAREEYKFMEAGPGDFQGLPIIYIGCVSKNNRENFKTHTVDKVTTDVELCLSNPDPDSQVVSDDGFVIVAAGYDGSDYFIITEASILGGSSLNNSLAWAQLHRDYHKYFRALSKGIMNNFETTFLSTKPTKKGEKITIPLCCGNTFNPDDTIKTVLGVGVVDKATFSFKQESLELEILYPADLDLVSNLAPTANNDMAITNLETPVFIDVLANDVDPDGTLVGAVIIFQPLHGTAVVQPDGKVLYTPEPGYVGDDLFIYAALDDWGERSNNALVSITVKAENTGPIAVNDSYTTNRNIPLDILASIGLFINDSDDTGFSLDTYDTASTQGGTVFISTDGAFQYSPPFGFSGTDTFTYTIKDAANLTSTATVTINVLNPANPVAVADFYVTKKNTTLYQAPPGQLGNDTTQVGSLSAVYENKATTQGGTVEILTGGGFNYYPPSEFVGIDTFTYTVSNGIGTDTGTVTVRVLPNIFIKIEKINPTYTALGQICEVPDLVINGGESRTAKYKLFFYSNAGGTIPLDTTGLGLVVGVVKTGQYYSVSGGYTYTDHYAVSGTTFELINGEVYEFYRIEYDCNGYVVDYKDETFTIEAGYYTVI